MYCELILLWVRQLAAAGYWQVQALAGVLRLCAATKKQIPQVVSAFLARRKGLEPLTFWFVAKHSIQLS